MSAYYNEIDPYAAQWLRNLIAAGHIAPGYVDERSITDVRPDDLRGYEQCHFFAGIGGWSLALRLAGWPDARPVWTGSCPCQPFSAAGKQRGSDDERHLWPTFFDLIRECRPASVFGEQVAGAAGLAWLDHVAADLEGAGYAAAAANLGAHSVGAPHLRQRLYWVAHDDARGRALERTPRLHADWTPGHDAAGRGAAGRLAHANSGTAEPARGDCGQTGESQREVLVRRGAAGDMDNAERSRLEGHQPDQGTREQARRSRSEAGSIAEAGVLDAWGDLEWLQCSDGKARPTQPGLFPLAHGIPNRVGRLRAYGNAIVPQVAAVFVMANV